MSEPHELSSPPEGYYEALAWGPMDSRSRFIQLQLLGALITVISAPLFCQLGVMSRLPDSFTFGLGEIGAALAGIVLTFTLHELIHGWTMQLFGAKPRYGVLWRKLMLYATAPGVSFSRGAYLAVALAPLAGITLLVILGLWLLQGTPWVVLLALCGALNAGGAIGDIAASVVALRFPASARIVDEKDALRVFLPGP